MVAPTTTTAVVTGNTAAAATGNRNLATIITAVAVILIKRHLSNMSLSNQSSRNPCSCQPHWLCSERSVGHTCTLRGLNFLCRVYRSSVVICRRSLCQSCTSCVPTWNPWPRSIVSLVLLVVVVVEVVPQLHRRPPPPLRRHQLD